MFFFGLEDSDWCLEDDQFRKFFVQSSRPIFFGANEPLELYGRLQVVIVFFGNLKPCFLTKVLRNHTWKSQFPHQSYPSQPTI